MKILVRKFLFIFLVVFCMISRMQLWAEEQPVENPGTKETESADLSIDAGHGVLMEVSTGKVIFQKDAHTPVPPASVTKIMTMLLIFEALEEGTINLQDQVSVSEHAASMGGSQVFLEPNEKQTVETMLKCIAVASANDACVAMAEYVAGSEPEFVNRMNERAKALGMKNTHFKNCNGLDEEGHVISAYDVALMSRELLKEHPQIHEYCTIWMENILHTTAKGSSEFGLSNTNKLIRQYEYCTGLKTGSTGEAGFCVSASAKKDEMELIAVVMNGETSKSRFADAKKMLEYGFHNYRIYRDTDLEQIPLAKMKIQSGVKDTVQPRYGGSFMYLLNHTQDPSKVEKRLEVSEPLVAPVKEGDLLGKIHYYFEEEKIGEVPIISDENIKAANYTDYLKRVWLAWMM